MNRVPEPIFHRFQATRLVISRTFCMVATCALVILPLVGCQSLGTGSRFFALRAQTPESKSKTIVQQKRENKKVAALVRRAQQQYQQGKLREALSSIRSAHRVDSGDVSSLEMEARIAFDLGDDELYLNSLRSLLEANPKSAKLHNAAGILLLETEQSDIGFAALEKAVALEPFRAQFSKDLAAACLKLDRQQQAENVLANALDRNPGDTTLPIALARIHEARGNWSQAAQYLKWVQNHDPDNPLWRRQLARSLYKLGEYDNACEVFSDSLHENGFDLSLSEFIQFGDACLRTGRYDDAQEIFDEISRRSLHRRQEVELLRGLCALKRGRTTHAKGILGRALTEWPENEELQKLLALCNAVETEALVSQRAIAVGQ